MPSRRHPGRLSTVASCLVWCGLCPPESITTWVAVFFFKARSCYCNFTPLRSSLKSLKGLGISCGRLGNPVMSWQNHIVDTVRPQRMEEWLFLNARIWKNMEKWDVCFHMICQSLFPKCPGLLRWSPSAETELWESWKEWDRIFENGTLEEDSRNHFNGYGFRCFPLSVASEGWIFFHDGVIPRGLRFYLSLEFLFSRSGGE